MIKKELYVVRKDGVSLYINYSDANKKILQNQTGILFDCAIDVETAPYTYTETNEPADVVIDPVYHEPPISAEEALEILMGGSV